MKQATLRKRLATRLGQLRAAKGWSQAELARRAGTTQPHIVQLEQGVLPRADQLRGLCMALGVPANYLLSLNEKRLKNPECRGR